MQVAVQRYADVLVVAVDGRIDYVNAEAIPLPKASRSLAAQVQDDLINTLVSQITLAESGSSAPGSNGTGAMNLVMLGMPHPATNASEEVMPQEFGTNNHPFSTARADLSPLATNTAYPYSASGKLFFNKL